MRPGLAQVFVFSLAGLDVVAGVQVCSVTEVGGKGNTCKYRGSLQNPKPLRRHILPTIPSSLDGDGPSVACLNKCVGTPGCLSWSYNSTDSTCTRYRKVLQKMNPTAPDPSSSTIFSDLACTNVTSVAAIANPEFRIGVFDGWDTEVKGEYSALDESSHYGGHKDYMAFMEAGGDQPGPKRATYARLSQYTYFCPNETYTISFDYFYSALNRTGAKDYFDVYLENKAKSQRVNFTSLLNDLPAGSWQSVTLTPNIKTDNTPWILSVALYTYSNASNVMFVDHIAMQHVSSGNSAGIFPRSEQRFFEGTALEVPFCGLASIRTGQNYTSQEFRDGFCD